MAKNHPQSGWFSFRPCQKFLANYYWELSTFIVRTPTYARLSRSLIGLLHASGCTMRTVDFWLTRLIFCNTYYLTVLIGLVVSVWVGQGYVLLNPARHYYRPKSPISIPYIYRSYSQAVYPEAFTMCGYDTTYPSWLRYTTLTSCLGFDRPQPGRSELPAIGALPMS